MELVEFLLEHQILLTLAEKRLVHALKLLSQLVVFFCQSIRVDGELFKLGLFLETALQGALAVLLEPTLTLFRVV